MAGKTKKAAKREALDIRVAVNREDLAKLDTTAADVIKSAMAVKAAADKMVTAMVNPQRQLHRRVQVIITDAEGVGITSAVYDLKATDELGVRITGVVINASVENCEKR